MGDASRGAPRRCICEPPRLNDYDHRTGVQHFDVRDKRGKWHRCEHDELARTTLPGNGTGIVSLGTWLYPKRHIVGSGSIKGLYTHEWHTVKEPSPRAAKRPRKLAIRRTVEEEKALAEAKAEYDALEQARRTVPDEDVVVALEGTENEMESAA